MAATAAFPKLTFTCFQELQRKKEEDARAQAEFMKHIKEDMVIVVVKKKGGKARRLSEARGASIILHPAGSSSGFLRCCPPAFH